MVRKAVLVGVDEYSFDPLAFAVNDAEEMEQLLRFDEYGFETVLLTDFQATRSSIIAALTEAAEAKPEIFIFYFSGHAFSGVGKRAFLATPDATRADEGLDVSYLMDILDDFPDSSRTIALLDCCHSGSAAAWQGVPPASRQNINSVLRFARSRAVYAACRPDERSYSAVTSDHGAFTHHLLNALTGAAANPAGHVTIDQIYSYVARHLDHSGQTTTFRCDSIGQTVLGSGFTPTSVEPLTRDQLEDEALAAKGLLDDFNARLSQLVEDWSGSGYDEAARSFKSVRQWFERRSSKHPELRGSDPFRFEVARMEARFAYLQALEPGFVFDNYRVKEFLGSGGFGAVWRLESLLGGPDRALKVFSPSEISNRDKRRMFERGYRAMEKLNHEHVLRVHGESQVPLGFYMDFIQGRNLEQVGPMGDNPQSALRLMILIAETIKHAHDREVIHRDVKPANILISYTASGDAIPYLADFDLAWYSTATAVTREVMATLAYGAPEYLQAPRSGAARRSTVDTFGFAQLCFFVLVGSNPVPFNVALNCQSLRRRLSDWESLEAATRFIEWYERNSSSDWSERDSDFTIVIDFLTDLELTTLSVSRSLDHLSASGLLNEVYYSIAGLTATSEPVKPSSFRSLSGRSLLSLRVDAERRDVSTTFFDITAEIELDQVAVQGVKHAKAQSVINSRVERAIHAFTGVTKSFGGRGAYSVYIHISGNSGNADGVRRARSVLQSVLLAIETA